MYQVTLPLTMFANESILLTAKFIIPFAPIICFSQNFHTVFSIRVAFPWLATIIWFICIPISEIWRGIRRNPFEGTFSFDVIQSDPEVIVTTISNITAIDQCQNMRVFFDTANCYQICTLLSAFLVCINPIQFLS